jgi:hypothetical protein
MRSDVDASAVAPQSAAAQPVAFVDTRIDAAHRMRTEAGRQPDEPPLAPLSGPPEGEPWTEQNRAAATDANDEPLGESLHRQARQLQQLLDRRQQELDRRQAFVNAHSAELENQVRAARLWLLERQAELDQRESELVAREQAVAERASQLAAAEAFQDLARRENQQLLDQRAAELQRRESQLAALRQRLELESAALRQAEADLARRRRQLEADERRSRQQIACQRESSLELVRHLLAAVERRRQAVEAKLLDNEGRSAERESLESDLVAAQGRLQARRRQFAVQRKRAFEQLSLARNRLLQRARQWSARLRQRAQFQRETERQMLRRRIELEQLRLELIKKGRSLLELQLAADQLLAETSSRADRPQFSQALSEMRSKIAGQYQQAREELESQERQLTQLRREIAAEYDKLARRRQETVDAARRRRLLTVRRVAEELRCRLRPPAA